MMFTSLVAAVASVLVCSVSAQGTSSVSPQSSTSVYARPDVPTGTPIPGNYTGPLRPQIHFSPPQNFMNDPNGLFVDANGTWHLYYQFNPTQDVPGNQHWGHATSEDLYHWVNQPIAIHRPNDAEYVYSGSAVIDVNNTSGFFPDQDNGVVAIYTLASYPYTGAIQTQNIAYSRDGGYTFTPYERNPVIPSNLPHFRDPKVIWYEDHWVMVVAFATEFSIGIYTSPNLINWTFASNFSYHGLLGYQYECPSLQTVPVEGTDEVMWLMFLSINPGAPLGGSISQYFPGYFNGTHFEAVDPVARIADFGKDNYAGQFFYGTPPDEAISIAWASNWQYTGLTPSGPSEGWRSSMSLPRRNYLANATRIGWVLLAANDSLGNGTILVDYSSVYSNALYFEVNVTDIPRANISGSATLNFTFLSLDTGEPREHKGFENVFYTDKFSTVNIPNGTWSLSGVIDRSILEVFINGGEHSATITFFPTQPLTVMALSTMDLPPDTGVSVAVYALESAWQQYENENGTVVGNVTESTPTGRFSKRYAGHGV
ncbi:Invertase [Coniosporium tulheliwenetii]|uniref:Invertase n=1 Tax=Coniosporium tulheliwenetii TaxID=3383036 RepID=A0ACC2ZDK0_9PEZI|nr:Invertase [Cladosporium sp. JES 115]